MILSIFACAYWPFACFLWRNVYLGLLFIFQLSFLLLLLLSCISSLHISDIDPLSDNVANKGLICKMMQLTINFQKIQTALTSKKQNKQPNPKLGRRSRHFSKEEIQMVNRHIKRCSTPLIIREIQINTRRANNPIKSGKKT